MSLNKKLLIFTFIVFITFSFINEISSYLIGLKKYKEESYNNTKTTFSTIMKMKTNNIETLALTLVNDAAVKNAYINNDPELIKEHLTPFWKEVSNKNLVYEIHFFKPPAESFVNFSNFKSIGKDVSDARMDITWITSTFKSSSHVMMCKTYAGIRATYPIIDKDGQMLGGLSLGKKIDWLPNSIKEVTKYDAFLVYAKDSTSSLFEKYYNDFVKDKEIIGEFILANKTIKISANKIKEIDFDKEIQDITINDVDYSLNIYPILDFEENNLAYVCVLNNLDHFYEKFFNKTIRNILLLITATLLVYLLLKNKITSLVKRIKAIEYITNNLTENNFKILDKIETTKYKDELSNLEIDILKMGKSLEKNYIKLEEKLDEQVIELKKAQSVAKIGSWNVDMMTNISTASDELYKIFGLVPQSENITIEYYLSFVHPDDKKYVENIFNNSMKNKENYNIKYKLLTYDNRTLYCDDIVNFKYDLDNNIIGIFGTLQDITAQELLRIENENKNELLMQQSKMASMGEMLESIAHQWRQPLSVITSASSGMKVQKEFGILDDNSFVVSCDSITDSANHLSQTIDDFRSFFKEEKEKHNFIIKDIFEDTFKLLISKFKNQNIEFIKDITDVAINGFGNELVQVFMNILNNSRDELENKGTQRKIIFINIYEENNSAIITIKDNAGGIPIDILPKIFDSRFTTKGDKDGTGIGLYMTQKIIVDNFKGTIEATNKEYLFEEISYKGAEFKIILPLS